MQDTIIYPRAYFFDQGLRFACRQCGNCCTGASGTVYVSGDELILIAEYLKIEVSTLTDRYLYPFKDSYSIHEDQAGNCLFFQCADQSAGRDANRGGCRIYPVRPHQCRVFPFWFSNLRSEHAWAQIASQCPGIGNGPLYTRDQILALVGSSMHI